MSDDLLTRATGSIEHACLMLEESGTEGCVDVAAAASAALDALLAEIAAMRPIVEAVADIENSDGSACLQLCDTMYLTTPTESAWRVQHRANCVIEQARAYVAQHPTSERSGNDGR